MEHINDFKACPPSDRGYYNAYDNLEATVKEAFQVIEAIPKKKKKKKPHLKIDMFVDLDWECPRCNFSSNSSSFRSTLMLEKVSPNGAS